MLEGAAVALVALAAVERNAVGPPAGDRAVLQFIRRSAPARSYHCSWRPRIIARDKNPALDDRSRIDEALTKPLETRSKPPIVRRDAADAPRWGIRPVAPTVRKREPAAPIEERPAFGRSSDAERQRRAER